MFDKIKAMFGGAKKQGHMHCDTCNADVSADHTHEAPAAPVAEETYCETCSMDVPADHTHEA
jgi:hypothetical protein